MNCLVNYFPKSKALNTCFNNSPINNLILNLLYDSFCYHVLYYFKL